MSNFVTNLVATVEDKIKVERETTKERGQNLIQLQQPEEEKKMVVETPKKMQKQPKIPMEKSPSN